MVFDGSKANKLAERTRANLIERALKQKVQAPAGSHIHLKMLDRDKVLGEAKLELLP